MKTFRWAVPEPSHPGTEPISIALQNSSCPKCSKEMDHGTVKIEATTAGFMFFGFSYKHLFFRGKREKEKIVLQNNASAYAYRCEKCGITIIQE